MWLLNSAGLLRNHLPPDPTDECVYMCVCVCVRVFFVHVHLKFSNAKAPAMGTDSPSRAACQCCNERCICKAAKKCVCMFVCPIKRGFLFTCWWGVCSKLIAYQESKPALPLVMCVCMCVWSCVCVFAKAFVCMSVLLHELIAYHRSTQVSVLH